MDDKKMKHTLKVTIFLVLIFLFTQVIGLAILNKDIKLVTDAETGELKVYHDDTAIGPRPETKGASSFVFIVIAIFIGTMLLLVLIKYQKFRLWKLWFFIAVWLTISVSFGVFMSSWIALLLALIFAYLKIFKQNPLIHNLSELFMYSGIAVLLVPIFTIFWMSILLILVSAYDIFAVYKSKHMVKMAKFQTKAKLFAGLSIPYAVSAREKTIKKTEIKLKTASKKEKKVSAKASRTAILGGGDIAFPLLFSGVVMEWLIDTQHYAKVSALWSVLIITICVTIALLWLFVTAEKDKFYPAMPIISLGCFVGYGVLMLITLF